MLSLRSLVVLTSAAPLTVAVASCTLQTSGLDRAPPGEQPDAASAPPPGADASQAPVEASTEPPAALDAPPPPASSGPDAAQGAGSDAQVDGADAGPISPQCDQDADGHASLGGCGGDDCCDTDARAHPGDTAYFEDQDACGSFDYDCNGREDPQHGQAGCNLDFFGGSCGGDGFASSTACGATGSYTSCNYAVFTCSTSSSTRVQGCR